MSLIEIEEIVEFEVHCPKDGYGVDPEGDCPECDHYLGEVKEKKKYFVKCGYKSINNQEKR
jgi:hypothetical protein